MRAASRRHLGGISVESRRHLGAAGTFYEADHSLLDKLSNEFAPEKHTNRAKRPESSKRGRRGSNPNAPSGDGLRPRANTPLDCCDEEASEPRRLVERRASLP